MLKAASMPPPGTSLSPVISKYSISQSRLPPRPESGPSKTPLTSLVTNHHQLTYIITSSGGRNVKIESHKINYKENAKPRIEDKVSASIPKSSVKIPSQKLVWKAESKIGSLDNANHKPAGGDVKILHKPLQIKEVQSKIGSLGNAAHVPGGGNVRISEYTVNTSRSSKTDSRQSVNSGASAYNSRRSSTSGKR